MCQFGHLPRGWTNEKEDWLERRKETALKEFELARRDLLARQKKTRDPTESNVIAGMLYLVEGGIQVATMGENPMPRWFQGLLYGLANPLTGAKYRKVLATLKKFDIEEIDDVPGEVLEVLDDWQGDQEVGLFTLQAAHHVRKLYELVNKAYVRDVLDLVNEIESCRRDPSADPADSHLARIWGKLPDAIAMADTACELLEFTYETAMSETPPPDVSALETALEHAGRLRMYLTDVRTALDEGRSASAKARAVDRGSRGDVAIRGRDLYHNRIREEITAEKGALVVIDVNSGDYEVDTNEVDAWMRLRERRPDAITWVERVGYPAPYRMEPRITNPR